MNNPLRLLQLNDVRVVGRLTRDPELRFTTSGVPLCRFGLAVNRPYKDSKTGAWKEETAFIPIVVWREAGQRCGDKLKKGSSVYVEGRLKSRSWETKEGQKRTTLEVEAFRVQFLDRSEIEATPVAEEEGGGGLSEEGTPALSSPSTTEEVPF